MIRARRILGAGLLGAVALAAFFALRLPPTRTAAPGRPDVAPAAVVDGDAAPAAAPEGAGAVVGVVRRGGEPAAARVEAWAARPDGGEWSEIASPVLGDHPVAVAGAGGDGRFAIEGLAPGAYVVRAVDAAGAAAFAGARIDVPGERVGVRLALPEGSCLLAGRAEWSDGRPFRGLVLVDPAAITLYHRATSVPIATDADGRFVVSALPPGEVRVVFLVPGRFRYRVAPVLLPADGEVVFVVDPDGGEIAGRVLDTARDRPISGAAVLATSGVGDADLARRVVAGADGRFRVGVIGGGARIRIRANGYAPGALYLRAGGRSVDVRISRAGAVRGRVVTAANGSPVSGVEVRMRIRDGRWWPEGGPPGDLARSGPDGAFVFPAAAPGEQRLDVVGGGFVSTSIVAVAEGAGDREATIPVVPAAHAEVTVLDAAGRPLPGATVVAGAEGWPGAKAVADADGRASFDSLPVACAVRFVARVPGRPGAGRVVRTGGSGETTRVELRVRPGRTLTVSVVEAESRRPVEGAFVEAFLRDDGAGGERRDVALTGPDGRAGFPALPPQAIRVIVQWGEKPDYPETADVAASAEDAEATVEVRRGLRLSGRVIWNDGSPVRGGEVFANRGDRYGVTSSFGEDGRFLLRGLAPGRVTVAARTWSAGRPVEAEASFEAGAEDVEIRLPPPDDSDADEGMTFLVLDPEGRRVPSAGISVWTSYGGSSFLARVIDGEARIDHLGYFQGRRSGDEPETAQYAISDARDHSGARLPLGPVQGGPVPYSGRVEVRLPPERTISGRVVGPDGEGLAGVVVSTRLGAERRTVSGADGRFLLGGLGDGRYPLAAEGRGVVRDSETVEARGGDEDVVLRLGGGETIRVTVRDEAGAPVAGAVLRMPYADVEGTTDRDGVATFGGFPTREWFYLEIRPPADRLDLLPDDHVRGGPGDNEVTLRRALWVRGVVRDEAGKLLDDGTVWATNDPKGDRQRDAVICRDGTFVVGPFPPGPVRIAAMRRLFRGGKFAPDLWESEDRIVPAGTSGVELVFRRGRRLAVRVVGWTPSEAKGTSAMLTVEGRPGSVHGEIGEDGVVVFRDLPPDGIYSVFVHARRGGALLTGLRTGGEARAALSPGLTVRGRVLAPKGTNLVQVGATGTGFRAWADVDETGAFVVSGLPAWPATLLVRRRTGWRWHETEVEFVPGEEPVIDLRGD